MDHARAAEHTHILASLRGTIAALAAGNPQRLLELPLQLDLAPAALQCVMSLGAVGPEHVSVQSIERLCLCALGLEAEVLRADPNRNDNLLDFAVTQQGLFGKACTHLMHGQGGAAALAAAGGAAAMGSDARNAAVFMARHNSGQHHPRTVIRHMPAADVYGGAQLTGLLNFFEAARARGKRVTYCPAEGRVVILVDLALDGMMLGAGAMVSTSLSTRSFYPTASTSLSTRSTLLRTRPFSVRPCHPLRKSGMDLNL